MYYKLNDKIQQVKLTPRHVYLYAMHNNRLISVARINKSAYDILNLCDGSRTEEDIITLLYEK